MNLKLTFGGIIGTSFGLLLCSAQPAYPAGSETDPCSLLTQAQVSAVLGTSVEPAKRLAPSMCGWSAPNQPNSANGKKVALVMREARAFGFAKTPVVSGVTTAPANGVCDDAVYSFASGNKSGLATALYVKKGATYFAVHVYGFPDQAKAMAMEKTLAVDACSKL
jgi:hypothetical protein